MKLLSALLNIVSYVFFFLCFLVLLFTFGSNNQLFGAYRSYLVRSGSMEPTIMTGDVIVIKELPSYQKEDIVTFKDAGDRIVTHRIVEVKEQDEETVFVTKGDANRSLDNDEVPEQKVLGKVQFMVPKMGYFISFSQSLPGLIVLILVPVFLLIFDQILKSTSKTSQRARN